MNKQDQRIAIAEALGWKEITFTGTSYQGIPPQSSPRYCNWKRPAPAPSEEDNRAWYWIPDFLNDLNAMHEAEQMLLRQEIASKFRLELCRNSDGPKSMFMTVEAAMCHATAEQRAEAFLRTLNLWKE